MSEKNNKNTITDESNLMPHKGVLVGIVVTLCVVALLYFFIHLFSFNSSDKIETTQALYGNVSSSFDGQYTALALRSEKTIEAEESGYINFLVSDTSRIRADEEIYVIDSEGSLNDIITSASSEAILDEDEMSEIKDSLFNLDVTLDANSFYDIYNQKYKIKSRISEMINSKLLVSAEKNVSKTGINVYSSDISGIIANYIDGYEEYTTDSVCADLFRKTNYSKTIISSNDYVSSGTPIYKVIDSEDWNLVFKIDNPDDFQDINYLSIKILKDNISLDCDFSIVSRSGNYYGFLNLDKYMIRYISDRFLNISIENKSEYGLKVPKTAVDKKLFYVIPSEYFNYGGNTTEKGLTLENNSADYGIEFINVDIVKETDSYVYVSTDSLKAGDILLNIEDNSNFVVGVTESLPGVYVKNGTTPVFKIISILGENDDNYIIDSKTTSGVRLYDNIVKNYKDVAE